MKRHSRSRGTAATNAIVAEIAPLEFFCIFQTLHLSHNSYFFSSSSETDRQNLLGVHVKAQPASRYQLSRPPKPKAVSFPSLQTPPRDAGQLGVINLASYPRTPTFGRHLFEEIREPQEDDAFHCLCKIQYNSSTLSLPPTHLTHTFFIYS